MRCAPNFGVLLWSSALALLACGGGAAAPPASPTKPAEASGESAASQCIAQASAPRERRADEPTRVTVKHILVKHADAERAGDSVSRSREDACLRALAALKELEGGASFDDLVAKYSDEAGAATRAGTLGEITRDDVAPPFADAAFRLDIDQVSHVVESPFGFHLILRTQ